MADSIFVVHESTEINVCGTDQAKRQINVRRVLFLFLFGGFKGVSGSNSRGEL